MPKAHSRLAATLLILFFFWSAGCNRDPNYAKQQYLKSGNKYYDRGRYKEALIMYRKALTKDPKFGEAYYRLALTLQATGQGATLVGVLRRATELLPKGSKEWNDSALRLGEFLVQGAIVQSQSGANKALMDEVNQLQAALDAKSPNSFEDLRLKAEVERALAAQARTLQDMAGLKKYLEDSILYLRRSLQARPDDAGTAVALARELSIYGETAEAEQIYKKLIDQNKTLKVAYLELYRLDLAQKRDQEAGDLLKRAIAANPKDFSFRTMLAAYYFSHNQRADMTRVLDDMKSDFKDFPQAYLTSGDFYARIGDYQTAVKEYKTGEQKDSKNKLDYQKRQVEVLLRENNKDAAYSETLNVLKESPKDPDARAMEANFELDRGDIDKAITTLQEVVTAKPENFVARFNLGRAYAAKGDFGKALQQYQESVRLRPDFLKSRIGVAETEIRTGNYAGALKMAQDTEKMSPSNANIRLLEAITLMRTGKLDDAHKILQELTTRVPQYAEANIEYGDLNVAEKNYPAARDAYQHAFDTKPSDPRGLFGIAETDILTNQPDKGLALVQAQVNLHPERYDLLRGFANLKSSLRQYDSALVDYRTLLEKQKNDPRETATTYSAMGQLFVRKGDLKTAVDYLEKANALEPGSVVLVEFMAELYDHLGDTGNAQKYYRAALALDPNNAAALNNLAYSLASNGANLDEALTLATRAKQVYPHRVEINDTLGWIYLKKSLKAQALETFRDLTAKAPDNPTYHFHYCLALSSNGEKAKAKAECDAALARHPSPKDESQIRQTIAGLR